MSDIFLSTYRPKEQFMHVWTLADIVSVNTWDFYYLIHFKCFKQRRPDLPLSLELCQFYLHAVFQGIWQMMARSGHVGRVSAVLWIN